MTPVAQSIFTAPGGDCFRACVASVMDLPLERVPHFLRESTGGTWTQERWDAVRAFAAMHGYFATHLDPDKSDDREHIAQLLASDLHHIATGPSREHSPFGHCVVMKGDKYVHDPMPDGLFLAGQPWLYILILPEPPVAVVS